MNTRDELLDKLLKKRGAARRLRRQIAELAGELDAHGMTHKAIRPDADLTAIRDMLAAADRTETVCGLTVWKYPRRYWN